MEESVFTPMSRRVLNIHLRGEEVKGRGLKEESCKMFQDEYELSELQTCTNKIFFKC